MPTHKAYTFTSRTSPDTNQSLQKSMLSPTLRKNKKSSLSLKIKLCRHTARQTATELQNRLKILKVCPLKRKKASW